MPTTLTSSTLYLKPGTRRSYTTPEGFTVTEVYQLGEWWGVKRVRTSTPRELAHKGRSYRGR